MQFLNRFFNHSYLCVKNVLQPRTSAYRRFKGFQFFTEIQAFKNAGAYCFMMASNYNSRFRPAEVLWYNNNANLVRKREVFEDLTKNQILIDL